MTTKRQILAELILFPFVVVLPIVGVVTLLALPVYMLAAGEPNAKLVAGLIYGGALVGVALWWAIRESLLEEDQ